MQLQTHADIAAMGSLLFPPALPRNDRVGLYTGGRFTECRRMCMAVKNGAGFKVLDAISVVSKKLLARS